MAYTFLKIHVDNTDLNPVTVLLEMILQYYIVKYFFDYTAHPFN